jgi:hypothetical protein
MLNRVGGEIVSPDVMIDAALHILAAWVASSKAKSTTAESEVDIDELEAAFVHLVSTRSQVASGPALG